ncbi:MULTISPECIES: biotin synthase BioB [Desulfobacula]|uniref:Radical SAM domain protein n=2 Tax=Desulfobacula TaxID=28222 RepID=K0NL17_DESTT|nr:MULTISPECIES: radical SAM protein [Desulfobacula]CCK80628.1 radical SAM domain protein [Desulfobacula toluolica Tol2]SDT94379.1 biotin synthase [Desulfobacula phenolica]
MNTHDLIKKSYNGESLSQKELVHLLSVPSDSAESYSIMAAANRISKELSNGHAEIHAQFALNLAPCPCNCMFCSFANANNIFTEETTLLPEEAIAYAKQFEQNGANAIFVMTTAKYAFDQFIEMSQEIRRNLNSGTTLIANVGDQTLKNAKKIKDAGYTGVYHALRLREGSDTGLSPQKRKDSICNFNEAGLVVGTCVEPVGPEHTNEELAQMIEFTASFNPAYSGAARRITIPGTQMAQLGMITELRMAQIVAVTRLGMPRTVMGNCTHEPCTLGSAAGANLFWAELGANPRDIKARTEEGRGDTIEQCASLFMESNWDVLKGPSKYYNGSLS